MTWKRETQLLSRITAGEYIIRLEGVECVVANLLYRHYIENTSDTEDLVWIELYKSDRVVDISLTQWLALTPPEVVAQTLKVPLEFVKSLKQEKQILI